jgi:hypothetical protein
MFKPPKEQGNILPFCLLLCLVMNLMLLRSYHGCVMASRMQRAFAHHLQRVVQHDAAGQT